MSDVNLTGVKIKNLVSLTGDKITPEISDFDNAQGAIDRMLFSLSSRKGFLAAPVDRSDILAAQKNETDGQVDWMVRVPAQSEIGKTGEFRIKASNHKGNVEKKDFTAEDLIVMEELFNNTSDDILGFKPKVTSQQIDKLEISAEKKLILQKALTPRTIIKSAYFVRPYEPNLNGIANGNQTEIQKAENEMQAVPVERKISTKEEALAVAKQFLDENQITDYNPKKTQIKSSREISAKKHDTPLFWTVNVYRSNEPVGPTSGRQILMRADGTIEYFINCTDWDKEIEDRAKEITTAPMNLLTPGQLAERKEFLEERANRQAGIIAGLNKEWEKTATPEMRAAWAEKAPTGPASIRFLSLSGQKEPQYYWNKPAQDLGLIIPIPAQSPVLPAPSGGRETKDPPPDLDPPLPPTLPLDISMFPSDISRGLYPTNGYSYIDVLNMIPGQSYLVSGKTNLTADLKRQWEIMTPVFQATSPTRTFMLRTSETQRFLRAWNASLYNGPILNVTTNNDPATGTWRLEWEVHDLAPVKIDITVDGQKEADLKSGPYFYDLETTSYNSQPFSNVRNIGIAASSALVTIPADATDSEGYYFYNDGEPIELVTETFFDKEFVNSWWVNDLDQFVAPDAESQLTVSLTQPGSVIRDIMDETGNLITSITNQTANTYEWGDPLPLNWSVPAGFSGASFLSWIRSPFAKKLPRIYIDGGTRTKNQLGGKDLTVYADCSPLLMTRRFIGDPLDPIVQQRAEDNLHMISMPWYLQNGSSSMLGAFRWSIPTDVANPSGFRFPGFDQNNPLRIPGDTEGVEPSLSTFKSYLGNRTTAGAVIFAHGSRTKMMGDPNYSWRTTSVSSEEAEMAIWGYIATTNSTSPVNYSGGPNRFRETYLVICDGLSKGSDWPYVFGTPKQWDQKKCMKSIILGYESSFPCGPKSGNTANAFFGTWEDIVYGGITPVTSATEAYLTAKAVHSSFNYWYNYKMYGYGPLTFGSAYDAAF